MSYLDELDGGISGDPRIAEERARAAALLEEEKKSGKRKIKLLLILIPILLIGIIIGVAALSFSRNSAKYDDAVALLNEGNYDKARAAFAALGSFGDSAEQAACNVDYVHAQSVLENAEAKMAKDPDVAMAKYAEAKSIFELHPAYKDSAEMIKRIDAANEAYNSALKNADYEAARALLDDCQFASARAAFLAMDGYRDSTELAEECLYLRAKQLTDYIVSLGDEKPRNVYATLPEGGEAYDIELTKNPDEGMIPICEAARQAFTELGDYKDSAELAAFAVECSDFTKEFYVMCAEGRIADAQAWLNSYGDEIPDRDTYISKLSTFIRYCKDFEFYSGDITFLPVAVGGEGKCHDFSATVQMEADGDYLVISGDEENPFTLRMKLTEDGKGFAFAPDEARYYFVCFNQNDRLGFALYRGGKSIGGCEYQEITE